MEKEEILKGNELLRKKLLLLYEIILNFEINKNLRVRIKSSKKNGKQRYAKNFGGR